MTLSALNAWGQTSVEYTELRDPRIRFDRTSATNQTAQTSPSGTHLVPAGIEVIELIRPADVNLYIEIQLATPATTTVSLTSAQIAACVFEVLGNGLYRISGIDSLEEWDLLKSPSITINNQQGNPFSYTVTLHYSNNLSKSYTVQAQVVVTSTLASTFSLVSTADPIPAVVVSIISVGLVTQVQGELVRDGQVSLISTCVQPSVLVVKIKNASADLTSTFAQTATADVPSLIYYEYPLEFGPNLGRMFVNYTFSQPGTVYVNYVYPDGYIEQNLISVNTVLTEIPAATRPTLGRPIQVSVAPVTTTMIEFQITRNTGNIDNWNGLTRVTRQDLTKYMDPYDYNKNQGLATLPNQLGPNMTYVCLANCLSLGYVTGSPSVSPEYFNYDFMANWNTSQLTSMNNMFNGSICDIFYNVGRASIRDLSIIESWNTSNVTDMTAMFWGCNIFDEDLSGWCVDQIASAPTDFDTRTLNWQGSRPIWGSCPTNGRLRSRFSFSTDGDKIAGARSSMISRLQNVPLFEGYTANKVKISNANNYTSTSTLTSSANTISTATSNLTSTFICLSTAEQILQNSISMISNYTLRVLADDFLQNINSTTINTTISKFGASAEFSRINGLRDKNIIVFNNISWTIELWLRFIDVFGNNNYVFDTGNPADRSNKILLDINTNNRLNFTFTKTPQESMQSNSTLNANTWYHIAMTQEFTQGNSTHPTKFFINGQLQQTQNWSNSFTNLRFCLGGIFTSSNGSSGIVDGLNGYIDEFRISNLARYTNNFSVPTQAFTYDSNTLLLAHMDIVEGGILTLFPKDGGNV